MITKIQSGPWTEQLAQQAQCVQDKSDLEYLKYSTKTPYWFRMSHKNNYFVDVSIQLRFIIALKIYFRSKNWCCVMIKDKSLTYADSGVDIETGNEVVSVIKPLAQDTYSDSVLSNIGGFGGLFELHVKDYKRPILVSSTDGVGTKLKLAQILGKEHLIGIDLVAMCANDVIVQGAKPLFFLDYYATSKLEVAMASRVIQGIAQGCKESNMALIGGETAEMPGIYQSGDFDLA